MQVKRILNKGTDDDYAIDIVITWVDGSDPDWLSSIEQHRGPEHKEYASGSNRYRDWGTLKYLLRGIDRYCPWARRVHLVTSGHLPKWLNLTSPKLKIVEHKDFIPLRFLPTFSSHPIELNLHRIKGLAEKFVYFNDDTIILDSLPKDYFFKNGLPRDEARLQPIIPDGIDDLFPHIPLNVIAAINKNFDKKVVLKKNLLGWLNPKYGVLTNLRTLLLMPYTRFAGFTWFHLPSPFLKSTLKEVWNKENDLLTRTSEHKFRDIADVNQYIFKAWQYANGNFYPTRLDRHGLPLFDISSDPAAVFKALKSRKYEIVCINDGRDTQDFEKSRYELTIILEDILSGKSSFEL